MLAKASDQPTSMLNVRPLSRASFAPTGVVVLEVLSCRHLSETCGCAINAGVAPTDYFGSAYDL
ncbi:hypothetical protein FQ192_23745 [Pseudomonas sp. ANT_J12]|nr:hypothetical protein FQ192_23745 [Pseudomonas sp. ANT_J12]